MSILESAKKIHDAGRSISADESAGVSIFQWVLGLVRNQMGLSDDPFQRIVNEAERSDSLCGGLSRSADGAVGPLHAHTAPKASAYQSRSAAASAAAGSGQQQQDQQQQDSQGSGTSGTL